MARWRNSDGPEWPARLQTFSPWQWSEDEILEAASDYAMRYAAANGLEDPPPPDAWPGHMTAEFAYTHFRMRWAREHGRTQDLVDAMVSNRLRRSRRNLFQEDET
jgi:hypothetical protein